MAESKIAKTNKAKYGEDYYARIGAIGGRAKVPKGFSFNNPRKKQDVQTQQEAEA